MGALGSKNVSKLGNKGVSKICHLERSESSQSNEILRLKPQNDNIFSLAPWGEGVRRTGEGSKVKIAQLVRNDMSIQVSYNETDKRLDCHVADAPRNDKSPSEASEMNLTTYRPNDLTSFLNPSQPSLRKGRRIAFTLAEVLITLGIIGVVAALTLPSVIQNYQKKVTVERLKKTYSTLSQAVQMSVADNDAIETWDFQLPINEFMGKYIVPYTKNIQERSSKNHLSGVEYSNEYALADGVVVSASNRTNRDNKEQCVFAQLMVDINGDAGPNLLGKDIFSFYIVPKKRSYYNGGHGNIVKNVPQAGLYPDGYGFARDEMLGSGSEGAWRGCNKRGEKVSYEGTERDNDGGAFCTALIMLDGWQIKSDYKW